MMTRLYSSTVLGVDGVEVEVEVDFRPMAEKRTFIVGLPDAAVKERTRPYKTAAFPFSKVSSSLIWLRRI